MTLVIAVAFILGIYGLTLLRAILKRLRTIEMRAEGFHDQASDERGRVQKRDKEQDAS